MSHKDVFAKYGTSTRAVTDRIVSVYNRATETNKEDGFNWYPNALIECMHMSEVSGLSLETCVAVTSHLSPRKHWDVNKRGAMKVVNGIRPAGFFGANLDRAQSAIDSDEPLSTLNGQKTKRFAANILGDTECVTVDAHALKIALGNRDDIDVIAKHLSRPKVYEAFEHAYQLAAARIGVTPSALQAITWVVQRNGRAN